MDEPAAACARTRLWTVTSNGRREGCSSRGRRLHDSSHELGSDPHGQGRVEADLQRLLGRAESRTLGAGLPDGAAASTDRRFGPVDILLPETPPGGSVGWRSRAPARRRGRALTRYLELMNRGPGCDAGTRDLRRAGDQPAGPGARSRPRHLLPSTPQTTRPRRGVDDPTPQPLSDQAGQDEGSRREVCGSAGRRRQGGRGGRRAGQGRGIERGGATGSEVEAESRDGTWASSRAASQDAPRACTRSAAPATRS